MNLNELFLKIAQDYCGMWPEDKGCKYWSEMQQKMADEAEAAVRNNYQLITLPKIINENTNV